jgi:outer membrane receptor protein involved in Fe transport
VGWRDQLFVTAALRADANSAFGETFDAAYYPKLSGSWVVSDAVDLPTVETLRLRAAWGRSGMQPDAFAAVRTYEPSIGPGNVPTVRPSAIGNPDLKPEVGSEIELGFDASFFGDRVNVELTHYRQKTYDAILQTAAAPSGGFSSNQFVNAGQVDNVGWEFGLNSRLVESRLLGFTLATTVSTNKNTLTDDGGLPPLTIDGRGRFQHIEGYPLGGNWSRYIKTAQWGGAKQPTVGQRHLRGRPPGQSEPGEVGAGASGRASRAATLPTSTWGIPGRVGSAASRPSWRSAAA